MIARGHYSLGGETKQNFEEKVKNGIPNKCQILINDMNTRLAKNDPERRELRRQMYYIDLCAKDGPKVTKSYFNLGVDTFTNDYANIEGRKSTVLGAFLTNTKVFDFSSKKRPYRKL